MRTAYVTDCSLGETISCQISSIPVLCEKNVDIHLRQVEGKGFIILMWLNYYEQFTLVLNGSLAFVNVKFMCM